MIGRHVVAVVVGSLVTLGVVFSMQALIATARRDLDESSTRHFVDFVRVERQEVVEKKERRMEKPVAPEVPPPKPAAPRTDAIDPGETFLQVEPVSIEGDLAIEGLGLEATDGDYLPIVKIAPVYPWKAQTEGIEGYCIVEYTVTTTGAVRDVAVVEADPKSVFDQASIEAAEKFKYRPRVINGEPIEVRGVRNLFRYTLDG